MSAFKQIIIADRQCVTDIALQEYGCYEGVFLLLEDNADSLIGLHDVPDAGTKLLIQTPVPKLTDSNRAVAQIYGNKKTNVVSGAEAVAHNYGYVVTGYWSPNYTEVI